MIREMENKTAMRHHLTPVRMIDLSSINQQRASDSEDVKKRELSCTVEAGTD